VELTRPNLSSDFDSLVIPKIIGSTEELLNFLRRKGDHQASLPRLVNFAAEFSSELNRLSETHSKDASLPYWRYFIGKTRQPYPELLREIMLALNSESMFHWAFPIACALYFDISPVLFPQPHHPLRVLHVWFMAKMALYLASEGVQFSDILKGSNLDWGIIISGLLTEAVANVVKSHGEDNSLAKEVKNKFDEVRVDMSRAGPVGKLDFEAEWKKMRELAGCIDSVEYWNKLISQLPAT
jgi:hypothetical protein